ncbi:pseudaminic acid biosynthesis-associated methylase [Spirosoma sp. KNUC1025]|uniref:pseudaminic acid biosynthesis-associated methylase n=1 Tax=Spirosoma sp. KNUC1025 TaxID=2894082 RepID=UPI00386F77F0|nr:methyltransferase domain-containing protein [Spirosoma sp. KNUC1025]
MKQTEQETFWSGEFGQQYTDRNTRDREEWDNFYVQNWGLTKPEMNARFTAGWLSETRILEVGCNTGMQLRGLQDAGFTNLYGVELQPYAVEKAKQTTQHINILQGSGFDLPFRDAYFDVVCTNGVLIHIAPDDLPKIMDEMVRCSRRYIWGFEYYSPDVKSIPYRGNEGFLWKADYAALFQQRHPSLKLVKQELFPYVNSAENGNVDYMYLLEKTV